MISNSFKKDTNSYVVLLKWFWSITSWETQTELKIHQKQILWINDIITTKKNSLAVIEWWDKSITRLWENSKIIIKKNYVWDNLAKIQIHFSLLKWKTWSNIVTILDRDSYFKQDIKNVTASVRWTVFEANFDENYTTVYEHKIEVVDKNWNKKELVPWEILFFDTFSIEKLKQTLNNSWVEINKNLDKEYILKLREEFLNNIKPTLYNKFFNPDYEIYKKINDLSNQDFKKYFDSLDQKQKEEFLNKLNYFHQTINFEKWENTDLYNLKLNTTNILVNNISDENYKATLLKYSNYDLNDLLKNSKNQELIDKTKEILNKNKQVFEENVKEMFNNSIEKSKEFLQNNILNNLNK